MGILDRLLCVVGVHHRSRRKAVRTDAGWRSVCRTCGKPMVKPGKEAWRTMKAPPAVKVRPSPFAKQGKKAVDQRRRRKQPRPGDRGAPFAGEDKGDGADGGT